MCIRDDAGSGRRADVIAVNCSRGRWGALLQSPVWETLVCMRNGRGLLLGEDWGLFVCLYGHWFWGGAPRNVVIGLSVGCQELQWES